jgi:hypothetical protein
MQKGKTQKASHRYSGLQSVFNFMQSPFSPNIPNYQLPTLRGYRIDHQSTVQPIWGNSHHG